MQNSLLLCFFKSNQSFIILDIIFMHPPSRQRSRFVPWREAAARAGSEVLFHPSGGQGRGHRHQPHGARATLRVSLRCSPLPVLLQVGERAQRRILQPNELLHLIYQSYLAISTQSNLNELTTPAKSPVYQLPSHVQLSQRVSQSSRC